MPLTRDFRATVTARAARDPAFRASLYREAAQALLDGDLPVCKSLLLDLLQATDGLAGAAAATGVPARSLARMLGTTGNPRAEVLAAILAAGRDGAGIRVEVRVAPLSRVAA